MGKGGTWIRGEMTGEDVYDNAPDALRARLL